MRRQLDRFNFRIGPTTVALVKSAKDVRLWCTHTTRFSSSLRPTKENRMVCAGLNECSTVTAEHIMNGPCACREENEYEELECFENHHGNDLVSVDENNGDKSQVTGVW